MAASGILVVDDNEDTCASLSDIIMDLGYRVAVAYDGPAALELSRQHCYGLALLDYKLPGMDGMELHGHLKQIQADTVGVLVTGLAAEDTVRAAARAGAAGRAQAGELRPPDSAHRWRWPGRPDAPARKPCVCTDAPQGIFLSARRGGAMPVLNPVGAEPATSGLQELAGWPLRGRPHPGLKHVG
jgi:CheY-like chemotaxis protein